MSHVKEEEKPPFREVPFQGAVCSSFEVEFSEQVLRLVIVIKDLDFDHITATDKLSTLTILFLTRQLLFLSITISPIGKRSKVAGIHRFFKKNLNS